MGELRKIELEVSAETAEALSDTRRRAAVVRLIERTVRPSGADPLIDVLEQVSERARLLGFTEADLEAELAAYNAERRG